MSVKPLQKRYLKKLHEKYPELVHNENKLKEIFAYFLPHVQLWGMSKLEKWAAKNLERARQKGKTEDIEWWEACYEFLQKWSLSLHKRICEYRYEYPDARSKDWGHKYAHAKIYRETTKMRKKLFKKYGKELLKRLKKGDMELINYAALSLFQEGVELLKEQKDNIAEAIKAHKKKELKARVEKIGEDFPEFRKLLTRLHMWVWRRAREEVREKYENADDKEKRHIGFHFQAESLFGGGNEKFEWEMMKVLIKHIDKIDINPNDERKKLIQKALKTCEKREEEYLNSILPPFLKFLKTYQPNEYEEIISRMKRIIFEPTRHPNVILALMKQITINFVREVMESCINRGIFYMNGGLVRDGEGRPTYYDLEQAVYTELIEEGYVPGKGTFLYVRIPNLNKEKDNDRIYKNIRSWVLGNLMGIRDGLENLPCPEAQIPQIEHMKDIKVLIDTYRELFHIIDELKKELNLSEDEVLKLKKGMRVCPLIESTYLQFRSKEFIEKYMKALEELKNELPELDVERLKKELRIWFARSDTALQGGVPSSEITLRWILNIINENEILLGIGDDDRRGSYVPDTRTGNPVIFNTEEKIKMGMEIYERCVEELSKENDEKRKIRIYNFMDIISYLDDEGLRKAHETIMREGLEAGIKFFETEQEKGGSLLREEITYNTHLKILALRSLQKNGDVFDITPQSVGSNKPDSTKEFIECSRVWMAAAPFIPQKYREILLRDPYLLFTKEFAKIVEEDLKKGVQWKFEPMVVKEDKEYLKAYVRCKIAYLKERKEVFERMGGASAYEAAKKGLPSDVRNRLKTYGRGYKVDKEEIDEEVRHIEESIGGEEGKKLAEELKKALFEIGEYFEKEEMRISRAIGDTQLWGNLGFYPASFGINGLLELTDKQIRLLYESGELRIIKYMLIHGLERYTCYESMGLYVNKEYAEKKKKINEEVRDKLGIYPQMEYKVKPEVFELMIKYAIYALKQREYLKYGEQIKGKRRGDEIHKVPPLTNREHREFEIISNKLRGHIGGG